MKKILLLLFISVFNFTLYLSSISLVEYIEHNGMPQIRDGVLDLSNKNLTDISGLQNIPGIDQVWRLCLSNNQLTLLPDSIFNGLYDLIELDLNANQLETVFVDAFSDLYTLKWLFLNNNKLQMLSASIFSSLRNLDVLYINNNQLQELPTGIFNGLCYLKDVNLSMNHIKTLPVDIFNDLSNLRYLYLYGNQLQMLPVTIFNSLRNLDTLYLNNNQLCLLPTDIFDGLDKLDNLNLSGNFFSSNFIPTLVEIIHTISSLENLDDKPKEKALKEQPYSTLKQLTADYILQNINLYKDRLQVLPSDLLGLFSLALPERAEVVKRQKISQ